MLLMPLGWQSMHENGNCIKIYFSKNLCYNVKKSYKENKVEAL